MPRCVQEIEAKGKYYKEEPSQEILPPAAALRRSQQLLLRGLRPDACWEKDTRKRSSFRCSLCSAFSVWFPKGPFWRMLKLCSAPQNTATGLQRACFSQFSLHF
ncbi:uncharacterized protein WM294_015751 isoform 1-T2 [Sarcoramphus papa]